MAWVYPAVAIGTAVVSSMMNSSSDDKAGGQPMYMMANMPQDMQNRAVNQMNSMPMGMNVNYKGQNYPMMYGPNMRAMKAFYSPGGSIPYQSQPSGFSSGMSAMAPYMYMMANQIKNTNGSGYDPSMLNYGAGSTLYTGQ